MFACTEIIYFKIQAVLVAKNTFRQAISLGKPRFQVSKFWMHKINWLHYKKYLLYGNIRRTHRTSVDLPKFHHVGVPNDLCWIPWLGGVGPRGSTVRSYLVQGEGADEIAPIQRSCRNYIASECTANLATKHPLWSTMKLMKRYDIHIIHLCSSSLLCIGP